MYVYVCMVVCLVLLHMIYTEDTTIISTPPPQHASQHSPTHLSPHYTPCHTPNPPGRPVAVKRLLRHLYHLAHKELNTLILSDEHPNIVRCFAAEEDHEFLYLALERCCGSLAAIGTDAAFAARFTVEPNEEEEEKGGTEEMGGNEGGKEGREKGKEEGTTKGMKARQGGVCMPSAYAMQVARDVCEGLAALHKRGIVHRCV